MQLHQEYIIVSERSVLNIRLIRKEVGLSTSAAGYIYTIYIPTDIYIYIYIYILYLRIPKGVHI
jgi:hypothetical protein